MIADQKKQRHWLRGLVDFALNEDVAQEIARQQRTILADSDSAKAHFNLAVLQYSQGLKYEAISALLNAIEIDPGYAAAYIKLGEIYVGLGDYERAGSYAIKAAERGNPALLDLFRRYSSMERYVDTEMLAPN